MRFLISVLDDRTASALPDEITRIDAFNDELRANGNWIFAAGLADPRTSVVIDARGEREQVDRGPAVDSPEFQSGFWIIEASDEEEARRLSMKGSQACNRRVELRGLLGG